jgi:arsenate reductase (thioredoxin)
MSRVLFVCLHNAGRSQMSRALFMRAAGNSHEARSAGTSPVEHVHPVVAGLPIEIRSRSEDQAGSRLVREAVRPGVSRFGGSDGCKHQSRPDSQVESRDGGSQRPTMDRHGIMAS